MSKFYVLPPRPYVAQHLAQSMHLLFPELPCPTDTLTEFAENLAETMVAQKPDVYLVYREDLPADEYLPTALQDGYGAEPGDEVIEVRPGGQPGVLRTERWRV